MLFAGPGRRPGRHRRRRVGLRARRGAALADKSLSFAEFLRTREPGAARGPAAAVGELGDARRRSAPAATTPTSSSGRCPRASAPTATTPKPTGPTGSRRRPRSTTSPTAARFLLPPTWTQLDSLDGRTVAEVLAVERQIVAVAAAPDADTDTATGRSSSSTATATTRPQPPRARGLRPLTHRLHERVRQRPHQRRAARHRHPAAVAAADQRADPPGVPRDRRRRSRIGAARRHRRGDPVRRPRDLLRRRRHARAAHPERRGGRRRRTVCRRRPSTRSPRSRSRPSPRSPATRWAAG